MTFSVVARDPHGDGFGVAVASKFLAVGALVPAAAVDAGALATQAMANLRYAPDGLSALRAGLSAEEVVAALVRADPEAAHRQVGVVDTEGAAAAHTGASCIGWAGHRTGEGLSVQGNCLTGPEVVDAAYESFVGGRGPFLDRLVAALRAGDDAGGDKRGRQSAAVLVIAPGGGYGGGTDVVADLRVDDHAAPLPELERLVGLHHLYFDKPDPATLLPLQGELRAEVAAHLQVLGYDAEGARFAEALEEWIGTENYEERAVPDAIDPLVLDALRAQAAGRA